LAGYGIISGTDQGRFCPDDPITQEQFLMLAARVCSLPTADFTTNLPPGEDGSLPNEWASRFVQAAFEKRWFTTVPGYQLPAERLWAVDTVLQAIGYTEDRWDSQLARYSDTNQLGQRERRMLYQANRLEIVRDGQGGPFWPARSVTRGEAAQMLVRAYDAGIAYRLIKALPETGFGPEDPKSRRVYGYVVETFNQQGEIPELKRSIEVIQKYGDRLSHAMVLGYYFRDTVNPAFGRLAKPGAIIIGDTLQPGHPVHEHLQRLHEKGVKTLLTLQNWHIANNAYDGQLAHRYLANPASRAQLVGEIVDYVQKDGHAGVNIDFESLRLATRDYFPAFLQELKTALEPLGAELTVTIPPFTSVAQAQAEAYDLLKIGQVADYVMPMVYDRHVPDQVQAGPSSPYDWAGQVVDFNVRYFGKNRVVPTYQLNGWVWSSPRLGVPVPDRWDQEAPMYIVSRWAERFDAKPRWDETAKSWQLCFRVGTTGYEVWYDDPASLRWKLKLVQNADLPGVALWRLGVETDEFWQMMTRTLRPRR
ncbi:MAG: glycosyl hydrolase family 18 protein, partial [Heliobacteriaceae bacterium]|nr:glycosyl hydrolase family 18 protein [Heliobacteriaceae bacterium]